MSMVSSSWLQQITWRPASHDWYTTGKSANLNRPLLKRALIASVVLLSAILSLRHGLPSSLIPSHTTNHSLSLPNIPRKIWQTWHRPASALGDDGDGELKDCVTSWTDKNPHHRYELLTDYAATQWVHELYIDEPKVIETWDRTDDAILRADLVRYLLMLKEGGVYTDVDTCASRPISAWIAPEYANTTRCVIGLEEDKTQSTTVVGDYPPPALVGICQWTLMAAPGHPLMRFVVDEVVTKLLEHVDEGGKIVGGSANDVLSLTGPDMFTSVVLEALTLLQGSNVTESDLVGLEKPKQFGDVLIMTVSAFASGQHKSGSKDWGNEEQLLEHRWRGSWLQKHPWSR